jgi:hypothetical protein
VRKEAEACAGAFCFGLIPLKELFIKVILVDYIVSLPSRVIDEAKPSNLNFSCILPFSLAIL